LKKNKSTKANGELGIEIGRAAVTRSAVRFNNTTWNLPRDLGSPLLLYSLRSVSLFPVIGRYFRLWIVAGTAVDIPLIRLERQRYLFRSRSNLQNMASINIASIADTIAKSGVPIPWCEEFEKMINGKKFVHS
jgi:hypothetical protein